MWTPINFVIKAFMLSQFDYFSLAGVDPEGSGGMIPLKRQCFLQQTTASRNLSQEKDN